MNNGETPSVPRGRGRGWPTDNQPRELRRPRNLPDDSNNVPVSKSVLSADAKEWYPPNYTPQPVQPYAPPARLPRSSVQDRLRQAQDQNPYIFDEMYYSVDDAEDANLKENIANLITVMCEITFDPGKFDKLCGPLVDTFAPTLHDVNYTTCLVEAIVMQSIAEANFRYNGARLCSIYDSVAPPEESTFRECLLARCSTEENKIICGIEESEEKARGFAMFLAEIYTQLEDSQGGRLISLGESLCRVFVHLLETENEVNIKAVCQLLKLAGIALDADCAAGMRATFELLRRRAALPAVANVMALRARRWGLADAPDPHEPAQPPTPAVNGETEGGPSDGGFLADGHKLTAEERAFLQSHVPPGKNVALEEDILEELENDAWETGMDPEMQASFLEFLKMSNQINR